MAQYFSIHAKNPEPRLVRQAAAILRDGGVVAYPTDSSYALGCRLGDTVAAERIRAIRGVDDRHHLTLVCRDLAEIGHYARLDNWQYRIVKQGVPGSFTFLLPATREVPRALCHPRRRTIGVRAPEHPVVRALLAEAGEPILSATLILPGEAAPMSDPARIRDALETKVDLVIDAGACAGSASTIVDLAKPPAAVLRLGRGDPAALGI